MDELKELPPFLSHENPQVRQQACKIVCGFSTSKTHHDFFATMDPPLIPRLRSALSDDDSEVAKLAAQAMVNLADSPRIRNKMLDCGTIGVVVECLKKRNNPNAEYHCMLLQNLTIDLAGAEKLAGTKTALEGLNIRLILQWLVDPERMRLKGDPLRYLVNILVNLSQLEGMRKLITDPDRSNIVKALKEQLKHENSIRRKGVLLIFKNCFLEQSTHEYLLSEDLGLFGDILLLIVGNEDLDDDDTKDFLAEILVEMGPGKRRDPDPEIRRCVLDIIDILLSHKPSRVYLKTLGTYIIVRECHKYEREKGPHSEKELEELDQFVEDRLVQFLCLPEEDDPLPEGQKPRKKELPPDEQEGNDPNLINLNNPNLVRF